MTSEWLRLAPDGRLRCWWCGDDPDYVAYHDNEWGRPVTDDRRLFEKICLEGFQAGLSWLTILRKRENFRRAFADFEPHVVANFGDDDVARLLADAGIVRHRGKIEATINNARRLVELHDTGSTLREVVWGHVSPRPQGRDGNSAHPSGLATTSPSAIALSKDLKRRGWRFVGPTTVYSFMQSMGIINDHLDGCCVAASCDEERSRVLRTAD